MKIFVVAERQCTKSDMLLDVAEVNGRVPSVFVNLMTEFHFLFVREGQMH